jgi:hypothetical protein
MGNIDSTFECQIKGPFYIIEDEYPNKKKAYILTSKSKIGDINLIALYNEKIKNFHIDFSDEKQSIKIIFLRADEEHYRFRITNSNLKCVDITKYNKSLNAYEHEYTVDISHIKGIQERIDEIQLGKYRDEYLKDKSV